jgi:hypothetical protein
LHQYETATTKPDPNQFGIVGIYALGSRQVASALQTWLDEANDHDHQHPSQVLLQTGGTGSHAGDPSPVAFLMGQPAIHVAMNGQSLYRQLWKVAATTTTTTTTATGSIETKDCAGDWSE